MNHSSIYTPANSSDMKDVLTNLRSKIPGLSPFGLLDESIANFLSEHDRFHQSNYIPQMVEQVGNVFITRPKLNLSSPNLTHERIMSALNTLNPMSNAFMIRCLLDTEFAQANILKIADSPLLNGHSPFLIPLCNGLVGISGWPEMNIETESTEGGFYSEDQTFATGFDRLYKTYNFNLTFKDIPSSPIFNIFFYWLYYIASVTLGDMVSYAYHIDGLRLDYTVSIYQFILDPTKRYILKWAKATGCFPISLPIGDIFNFSEGSFLTESSGKFTIPFVVNNVKYNDYLRIVDFNILAERYSPDIQNARVIKFNSPYNYVGVPFIVATSKGYMLTYRDVTKSLPESELEPTDIFTSSSYKVPSNIVPEKEITGSELPVEDINYTGYGFNFGPCFTGASAPSSSGDNTGGMMV